jgi:hypothetical protein
VGMVIGQAITDCQTLKNPMKENEHNKNRNKYRLYQYQDAYDFLFNGERLPEYLESYGFKVIEIEYLRRKAREAIENKTNLKTDLFLGNNGRLRRAA